MVQKQQVREQFREIGMGVRLLNRPEVRNLAQILQPNELIVQAVSGLYEGGLALLVLTDRRLILLDQKRQNLILESLPIETLSEVDANFRFLNSTARMYTARTSLIFSSWSRRRLHAVVAHVQEQMIVRSKVPLEPASPLAHYLARQFEPVRPATRRQPLAVLVPALARLALKR